MYVHYMDIRHEEVWKKAIAIQKWESWTSLYAALGMEYSLRSNV